MQPGTTLTVLTTSLFVANIAMSQDRPFRLGIIGLDTSHSTAFTKEFNDPASPAELRRCQVVAAYPQGSRDIESSVSRVPSYTEEVKKWGVEIVDSIEALVAKVDGVLLESNDGRTHWEQIIPVLRAKKPVFVDKPVAGNLVDSIAIYRAAEKLGVPVFCSSGLRFGEKILAIRNGSIGPIKGCDVHSPCYLESTHPDFYWYGVHGCEMLYTVMGTGCEKVTRVSTPDADIAVGVWKEGRVGTFRGVRGKVAPYGGMAFGEKEATSVGGFDGYRPLVMAIAKFFENGKPPVSAEETIELYAFMEAADESKRQGGVPVDLQKILKSAERAAMEKVAKEFPN